MLHVAGHMTRPMMLLATALATFTGCAETLDADAPGARGGGKADGVITTITFTDEHSETADGPLVAGAPVRIAYDLDRLTACRGSSNGSEQWSVTGWVQFDHDAPVAFEVTRLDGGRVVALTPELDIPAAATTAAFWFTNNNRWGCQAYDSNFGANYTFDVEQRGDTAVLAFDAEWGEAQSAPIHALDTVVIHYAPERLAECAGSTGGHVAWGITGYWQVDDGPVHTVAVARPDGVTLVPADPTLDVPPGAELELWFEATNVWGCHAYDSDFGQNYRFRIE